MNYKDFHTKAGLVIGSPGFRVFDPQANLSALNVTSTGMFVSGSTDVGTMFSTSYQRVRWDDVSSLVIAASSSWNGGTVYIPNSGNWDSVYTTVNANSAGWGSGGSGGSTGSIYLPQSADWNLAYSTVTANSAAWASSGSSGGGSGGGTTGGSIAPNSFVSLTTAYNGTGVNITWTRSLFRYTITFDTPQSDTDYIVLTDNEGRDDVFMSVSNKTVSSFTIDSFDDDGQVLREEPTVVIVYGSDPTNGSGTGGGSTGSIYLPQSANWDTAYSSITSNSGYWDLADTSWTTITANSADWLAGGSGSGASGAAFVTDIVISDATVTNITRDTTQVAVDSKTPILTAETDGKNVTFTVTWDGSTSYWTDYPQVSGHSITKSNTSAVAGQGRRYTGDITLDLSAYSGPTVVPVTFGGGTQEVVLSLAGAGPEVLSFEITSSPQYGQDHYKQGDTLTFVVEFDTTDVASIELHGTNAVHGSVATLVPTSMNGVSGTFTTTIDVPTNNARADRPVVLTGRNSFGTQGSQYTSGNDNKLVDSVYGPVVTNLVVTSSPQYSQDHYKTGDDITFEIEFDTTNVTTVNFNGSSAVTRTVNGIAKLTGTGTLSGTFATTIEETSNTKAFRPVKVKGVNTSATIGGAEFTSGNIVETMKGPVVVNVTAPGTPPYSQTHYKDADAIVLTAAFDTTNIDHVDLNGSGTGILNATNKSRVTGAGTVNGTFNANVNVATSVVTPTGQTVKMTANNGSADGAEFTFTNVFQAMHGPVLSNGTFGSYPGSQTELKLNDTIQVTFDVDTTNINRITFPAPSTTGAQKSETKTGLTPAAGKIITTMTVGQSHAASTGQDNSIGGKNFPVRASGRGTGHSGDGPTHTSTNTVVVNNQTPTIGTVSVSYNGTQDALSGTGDTAQVTANITTQGTNPAVLYTDNGTGELTITDPTTLANTKTVTYASGDYRVTGTNYKIVVTRTTNDTETSQTGLVKIAAAAPTIDITSNNGTRMRSTSAAAGLNYTIRLVSDQYLPSAPTLSIPANAGTLGTFTWNNAGYWQATMNVKDADTKGSHTYTNLVATNQAGVTQNTINSGSAYVLGGFTTRQYNLPATTRYITFGTHVYDTSKLIVDEQGFRGTTLAYNAAGGNGTVLNGDINVGTDISTAFTIVDSSSVNTSNGNATVDDTGDTFWYLDMTAVRNNTTGGLIITLEETT